MIKTRLSKKDYVNISMKIILSRPITWLFIVGYAGAIISNVVTGEEKHLVQVLFQVFVGCMICAFFYFALVKSYKNNPRLNEILEYDFNDSAFSITGESFTAIYAWSKIPQVTKNKKWLLI